MPTCSSSKAAIVPFLPETHAVRLTQWMKNPQIMRYFTSMTVLEELTAADGAYARNAPCLTGHRAILDSCGQYIGVTGIECLDPQNRVGEGYILIGDRRYWGKGYAADALQLALRYSFYELGYHRIEANCFAENNAVIKLLEASGFTLEGCKKQRVFHERAWQDILLWGLLANEFLLNDAQK